MASQKEEATRLLLQAERSLVDDWSYENTLEASRKSLQLYQNSQDLTGIARATLLVAQSLVRKAPASENKDAKEFVAERRALATSSGDRHLQAALSVAEAELALDLRLSEAVRDAALEGARDAKATLIDLGDRELEAKATVAISMVLIKKCDAGAGPKCAREALKYAREAASMSQELEDRRLEAKCNFLLFSAKMYTESPWRDAIKYAKEACKIFKQVGAKWWSAVVSKTAADWAVMKGNGQDGVPFAQDAMDIFREVASDHAFGRAWEAASLNTLIAALADRGEEGREQALEVARDGADRLQATGDTLASAQAKLCLSGAYAQYGDIDDAIKAGEDALKLYRSLGDKQSELVCLGELSRLQMEAKEHGEALDICQDAVQLARESGDTRHEGRNLAALIRAVAIDGVSVDQWSDKAISKRLEERPLKLTLKREVNYFSPKDGIVARMARHQQNDIEDLASTARRAERDTDRAVEELKGLRHFSQENANMALWQEKVDMHRQWVMQAEKAAMFSEHLRILDMSNRGKPWTDHESLELRYRDHFCSPTTIEESGPASEDALALANRILLGLKSEAPLRVLNKQTTTKALASLRSEMHLLNTETADVAARIQAFRQVKTDWIGSEKGPPKKPVAEDDHWKHQPKDDSGDVRGRSSSSDVDSGDEGSVASDRSKGSDLSISDAASDASSDASDASDSSSSSGGGKGSLASYSY